MDCARKSTRGCARTTLKRNAPEAAPNPTPATASSSHRAAVRATANLGVAARDRDPDVVPLLRRSGLV